MSAVATHPRGRVWRRWHLLPAGGATAVKQRVQISLLVLLALILAVLLTGMVATFNLYRSAEDHYIGQVLPLSTTARDVLFQMQREETGARGFLPELLHARARVHAARGEHAARRETLRRGLHIAGENGAHGWEKRFHDALADTTEPAGGPHN